MTPTEREGRSRLTAEKPAGPERKPGFRPETLPGLGTFVARFVVIFGASSVNRPRFAQRCGRHLLVLAALAWPGFTRADQVIWSTGEVWEGKILGSGQGDLRLHDGVRLWNWGVDALAALEWHPVTQRMERAWQFLEAGQTAKTFTGEHYPTLEVGCTATLADGSMKTGHLLTTVFYLEQGGQTRKVIIRKKLRGQPGDSPADIRYPVRLVFDRQPLQARRRCRISLAGSTNQAAELALVTALPATTAMPIVRRADGRFDGEIAGSACVWAWRDAAGITVAWREAASTNIRYRVAQALQSDLRDFFDGRRLLGVSTNAPDETVLSLVFFYREGRTTLGGEQTQPWRLEVCRWRLASDGQNQFAARAVLFRGLRAATDPLPAIRIVPEPDGITIEDVNE